MINSIKKIELGLHEALVNAVVHGNLSNPKKVIRVRRILTPNWFVWQIQDEGLGIVKSKRVSSLPLKIDVNSGRGIYLIHKCQAFRQFPLQRAHNQKFYNL